jgi:hypothetical protein
VTKAGDCFPSVANAAHGGVGWCSRRRPCERRDPYAVTERWKKLFVFSNNARRWLWVPASAGTTRRRERGHSLIFSPPCGVETSKARSFLSLPREAWGGSARGRGGGWFSAIAVDIGNSLKHPHPTHRFAPLTTCHPRASFDRLDPTASRGRDEQGQAALVIGIL